MPNGSDDFVSDLLFGVFKEPWDREEPPYSHRQFEQAFWHLWTLNVYHVTMSFDVNMTILLDWALSYHLAGGSDDR